jgi:hypothetical protein
LVAARKNPTAKWSISDSKISVPYGAAFRREEDPDLLTTEFFKLKKKYLEFVDALVIREDNFSPTLIGDTIRKILIKLKCTEEQAFVAQFAFTEIFTNAFKGAANHLFKDVSFNFGRLADVKILGARLQAARSLRNHLISQTSLTVNIYNGGNTLKLAVNSPGMSQQSRLSLTRNLAHYQTMREKFGTDALSKILETLPPNNSINAGYGTFVSHGTLDNAFHGQAAIDYEMGSQQTLVTMRIPFPEQSSPRANSGL